MNGFLKWILTWVVGIVLWFVFLLYASVSQNDHSKFVDVEIHYDENIWRFFPKNFTILHGRYEEE